MAENGNVAAMRKALEEIDKDTELLEIPEDMDPELHPSHSFVAVQIRKIVRAALSEPPRNCDVGTVEEQYKRFKKFCFDNMGDGVDEPRCSKCPLGKTKTSCHFDWVQMPFVSNGKCEDAQ